MRRLVICLVCVAAFVLPRDAGLFAAELSAKQVVDSIDKAKRVLLKAQQPNGSWKTGDGNDHYPVGYTSLAADGIAQHRNDGWRRRDRRGLELAPAGKKPELTYTYEISLMIQALAAAGDGNRDIPKVLVLAARCDLEESQIREGGQMQARGHTARR